MQFAHTEEQGLVADAARGLFSDFAPTLRATIASADGYDRAQWRQAVAEMGFGALAVPDQFGGSGLGLVELSLLAVEMGRTLWPSPFLPSIATALPLLIATGANAWVSALAQGQTIATVLLAGNAAITRDGDAWRVTADGLAPFAHVADIVVVVTGTMLAVLRADAPGVAIRRQASMDATRPLSAVTIDATLPANAVRDGVAHEIADALDRARIILAAECLGAADAVLDLTVEYSKQRIQFGRPIGSFQALKHRMADMMIAVEAARSAVWYAAAATDEGDPAAAEAAAIAHFTTIETARTNAGHAIQLHGGIGFTWEHDAHLFFKRARSAGTLLGTPAASRARLARLIGLEAEAA